MSVPRVAAALLSVPSVAAACPVCFAADERTAWVYRLSTLVLSLLPFALVAAVAGTAVLLERAGRRSAAAEDE